MGLFDFLKRKDSSQSKNSGNKNANILDKQRAGLSYLDRCGTFDEAKLREFYRITGNKSSADIENDFGKLTIREMKEVKQNLRSTMLELISGLEELERNGIDLSENDV